MRLPWECHDQSQETNWRDCVTGQELSFFHTRNGVPKIDQSVKIVCHKLNMRVACSYSSAPVHDDLPNRWCYPLFELLGPGVDITCVITFFWGNWGQGYLTKENLKKKKEAGLKGVQWNWWLGYCSSQCSLATELPSHRSWSLQGSSIDRTLHSLWLVKNPSEYKT